MSDGCLRPLGNSDADAPSGARGEEVGGGPLQSSESVIGCQPATRRSLGEIWFVVSEKSKAGIPRQSSHPAFREHWAHGLQRALLTSPLGRSHPTAWG